MQPVPPSLDPAFTRKSQSKQIELLLSALRRERQRSSELNIRLDFVMRDYKAKVQQNTQYLRANEQLVEQMQEAKERVEEADERVKEIEEEMQRMRSEKERIEKEREKDRLEVKRLN
jgi:predicted  nucleic acid-binding Zn-ribbon protein